MPIRSILYKVWNIIFKRSVFYPFTPDIAKSKINKFSKITNWVKLKTKQLHRKVTAHTAFQRLVSVRKGIKLCITQGFTLGVKGLNNYWTRFCVGRDIQGASDVSIARPIYQASVQAVHTRYASRENFKHDDWQ